MKNHSNQLSFINYHLFIVLGLMLLVNLTAQAQNGGGFQKIENAKIALITNRLNLTPEQGQQFWPLYNEFDSKKKDIRKNYRKLVNEINTLTTSDDKILANLKETLSLQQKEVDLSKEYMARFLKIINVRQLAELYKTEQLFTNMLIQRLNKNPDKNLPD
jgi:Spy/CpxP family protein refolding chaperone